MFPGAPEEKGPLSKWGQTTAKVMLKYSQSLDMSAGYLHFGLSHTLSTVKLEINLCLTPICYPPLLYPGLSTHYHHFIRCLASLLSMKIWAKAETNFMNEYWFISFYIIPWCSTTWPFRNPFKGIDYVWLVRLGSNWHLTEQLLIVNVLVNQNNWILETW